MKKYLILISVLMVTLVPTLHLNAQFRIFAEPVAGFDPDGNPTAPGENPIVDPFGNPMPGCCENPSNGWDFDLSFGSFSVLTQLQDQIAAETRFRREMNEWLQDQERETLLPEMNRQMRTNHRDFKTAQRAYFKFFDKGPARNGAVVQRVNHLASRETRQRQTWDEKRDKHITEVIALDSWINCGFCEEFAGLVIPADGLSRSKAGEFKVEAIESFGDAHFKEGFYQSRGVGLNKLALEETFYYRLSNLRVGKYRGLSWEDRVFLMSVYLIMGNNATTCNGISSNCIPNRLAEYHPNRVWNDNLLYDWAKEFSPEIPYEQAIFDSGFVSYLINTEGLRANTAKAVAKREREKVLKDLMNEILPPLLNQQTTRAQLISEIKIYTDVIERFGSPSESQLVRYLKEVNRSFGDFSNDELYAYYLTMRKLRFRMQLNRVEIIITAVADSFQPVLELALWEVGGTLAFKLLRRLPSPARTAAIQGIIRNLGLTTSLSRFAHAQKYGIKTYLEHSKFFRNLSISRSRLGIEIHHLIEQRFARNPAIARWIGSNANNWKSIILTQQEHANFTRAWLRAIGRRGQRPGTSGFNTDNVPLDVLQDVAREIYRDFPEILRALGL